MSRSISRGLRASTGSRTAAASLAAVSRRCTAARSIGGVLTSSGPGTGCLILVFVTAGGGVAAAGRNDTAMILGVVRRNRRSLMTGTALQATVMLVLALPAGAQP